MAVVSEEAARERGPYLTESRALNLERRLAATEAKLLERIERQDRQIAELRASQRDQLRAIATAFVNALRDHPEGG